MSGLHEKLNELVAEVPVYGNLDRAIERARREQRRRNGAVVGLAAAAVIAVIVSLVAVNDDRARSQEPIAPTTTAQVPTESPSPAAWEPPSPLRAGTSRVVSPTKDSWGNPQERDDPRDAAHAGIDIRSVIGDRDYGLGSWQFQLAARVPSDPANRTITYGVVVDGDGDHQADCQIGIDNNGPETDDFHVWVTNLRTHEIQVQDGPPYGFPVEFAHPAEEGMIRDHPDVIRMSFSFLSKTHGPCGQFGKAATFYVWSSFAEGDQVTETDYAPDAAWLRMSCVDCTAP